MHNAQLACEEAQATARDPLTHCKCQGIQLFPPPYLGRFPNILVAGALSKRGAYGLDGLRNTYSYASTSTLPRTPWIAHFETVLCRRAVRLVCELYLDSHAFKWFDHAVDWTNDDEPDWDVVVLLVLADNYCVRPVACWSPRVRGEAQPPTVNEVTVLGKCGRGDATVFRRTTLSGRVIGHHRHTNALGIPTLYGPSALVYLFMRDGPLP